VSEDLRRPHLVTARREQRLARQPLRDYHVQWDDITHADVDRFEHTLDEVAPKAKKPELVVQAYLERHPLMLTAYLWGHGRWVIPQKRLGSEYVTDFVIGESSSAGFQWVAVELESPCARMFNKKGDPSGALNHALRQLREWRVWLEHNQNYAARSREEQGLGLTDISPRSEGLILIGRERELDPATNAHRRTLMEEARADIHTYDWLVRAARRLAENMERFRQRSVRISDRIDNAKR
jgi:hypothetical protein